MGKSDSRHLFFISTTDYQEPLNWPLTCSFYSWLVAKHNKRVKWHVTLYDEELTFVPKLNSLNSSESYISSQKLRRHWTMLPWKCATGDVLVRRTRIFFLVPCQNSQRQHSQRPHGSYGCTKGDLYDCNQGAPKNQRRFVWLQSKSPYCFPSCSVVNVERTSTDLKSRWKLGWTL